MKEIKNIIIINDFDYVQGGASKIAIQTANLLVTSDMNLKVYFFSAVHNDISALDDRIIKICTNQNEALKEKNKIKGFFNGIYNYKAKKELKKLLEKLDKEETIIHVHGWTKALSSSIFDIAFKMNFKVILTMHDYFIACPNGGYFNYKKNYSCNLKPLSIKCIKCNCDSRNYFFKIYRIIRQFVQNNIVKLNKKLEDVISISSFSENILKRTLNPKIKIHRIYNPIDINENIQKINKNTQKTNIGKNKYFLYVGRIAKEKGVDVFCAAVSHIKKEGVVVGDGPELEKLKEKYPKISFVGWKSTDEVKEYMKNSIALVFPSRCYETMGLSAIEANMIGIPVIVSSNTSATEFADQNIFENGNVNSLESILLKSNLKKKKMSKSLTDSFNSRKYIDTLIKEYKKILDS